MAGGSVNIRRDISDPFYRYKMERLQSKIEGKGNGIKTVVVNLSNVAQQLAHVIKYFGFELGAQTTNDPKDDRWIINGAHEASKLQDYLDGFINKFVLCRSCKNPETVISIKDQRILMDCKACGTITEADPRQKLSSFILKQLPAKGKKDKSTKKAERRARKEAERNGTAVNEDGNGSPNGSSDQDDDDTDLGMDAGSDDELTRRINAEAQELDEPEEEKEVEWTVDMSEEAIKARARDLPDDLKRALVIEGAEDEDGEGNPYDQFGKWILSEGEAKGGVSKLDDVEVYLKAKDLGIETKHKTVAVMAQTIFDENIVKQVEARSSMLKRMISSEKHEKAFLGGFERFVGMEKPELIPQVSAILLQYYQNDLVSEETLKAWGSKASKKYVDLATSKKVRQSAQKFIEWLETAESDEEDDESSDEDDLPEHWFEQNSATMDNNIPRNTPALLARIDQLRNSLIKRFENLVEQAAIEKNDRNSTALSQYQSQIETAALIRTSEDILTLTRQMQELWLFGQLKTLDASDIQGRIDGDAKEVAEMLAILVDGSQEDNTIKVEN
ncbi:putative eukaryotic translation initiation factor 5 [Aureobasidium pullulans]|nr:putative eukaryotic translation initiation factor 5 [Aureobasidium pullulans]